MGALRRFRASRVFHPLVLLGLLLCALALRLYGIDWDQGHFFHPDERFLLQFKLPELAPLWPIDWQLFFDPKRSPWNPRWFAYGSFPFYLLKLLYQVATAFDPAFTLDSARFLGRGFSAVADVGTILLVYLLGSKLYSAGTGLLAAAFATFAVLHIQLSHFATFDVLLTFFVLLTLYGAARVVEKADALGGALVGVGLGLGIATKISIIPLVVPIATAYFLYLFFPQGPRVSQPVLALARLKGALPSLALTLGLGLALFVVAQPYVVLDWSSFLRDTREQSEMALRIRDFPYTRQYIDTPPYLYQIQQLTTWGLGWPLGLVAWLGLGFTLLRGWIRREKGDLLLLSWV
ncbi:MAG TPA: glycosyltransferase family 39 protein, partial [Dehalococcoidia bacterium]|nr:glycosyltransferase family 39 protein [Dehalococcoidia bacterium]